MAQQWNLPGTCMEPVPPRSFYGVSSLTRQMSKRSLYSVKVQNLTDCGHLLEGDVKHAGQNQEEIELYPVAPWMAAQLLLCWQLQTTVGNMETELYLRITYCIYSIHIDYRHMMTYVHIYQYLSRISRHASPCPRHFPSQHAYG